MPARWLVPLTLMLLALAATAVAVYLVGSRRCPTDGGNFACIAGR
jgi:hypothetical protein